MNALTSQLTPATRYDVVARQHSAPKQIIAQWTETERAAIRAIEDAMIAAMPKHRRFNTAAFDVTAKSQAANHEYRTKGAVKKRENIYKALGNGPLTIRAIEDLTCINHHTVRKGLLILERNGRVKRVGQSDTPITGGKGPDIWVRT